MIDLSKVKSLSDLPENVRSIFIEADGVVSLDEAKLQTEADVANVKKAKDKEVAEHNATKAELAKFKSLNLTADEITSKIEDLESRSGNGSELTERLANLQRDHAKLKTESAGYKKELDEIKPEYENYRKELHQRKTGDALSEFVKTLKGVDAERLSRALKKDIMLGLIDLDESGENLICKDGGKLEDYAMDTAKDYGFIRDTTPGGSNPGARRIPQTAKQRTAAFTGEEDYLDDDALAQANR